jgi:hypothetical protein
MCTEVSLETDEHSRVHLKLQISQFRLIIHVSFFFFKGHKHPMFKMPQSSRMPTLNSLQGLSALAEETLYMNLEKIFAVFTITVT